MVEPSDEIKKIATIISDALVSYEDVVQVSLFMNEKSIHIKTVSGNRYNIAIVNTEKPIEAKRIK